MDVSFQRWMTQVGVVGMGMLFLRPLSFAASSLSSGPHVRLSGTLTFGSHTPVAEKSVSLRLTLSGTALFAAGQNGCLQSDDHMGAVISRTVTPDSQGQFTVDLPLAEAHSLTQFQCSPQNLDFARIDELRADVTVPADSQSCPAYCQALGASAALSCVSDCETGQRLLLASATLSRADIERLTSAALSDTLEWNSKWVITQLGPPVTDGPGADLIVDAQAATQSLQVSEETFNASDCAVVEQCVGGTGKRTLLRFDGGIENIGSSNLVLGSPVDNPEFEYSACHDHYHLKDIMLYELLSSDTHQAVAVGSSSVVGRKQGFCMLDMNPVNALSPSVGYDCDNQGLSSGWEDIYDHSLDCQWLDITGVPPGKYVLRITVNPAGVFYESDTANDSVEVPVTLSREAS